MSALAGCTLKVIAPAILSGSPPHALLVLVTSCCLSRPGTGKDSHLQVAPGSCILPWVLPSFPTSVSRECSHINFI